MNWKINCIHVFFQCYSDINDHVSNVIANVSSAACTGQPTFAFI